MREPMGTCPCPAGPPPEKLSNGPPGTRRSPANTALAWIRGYMDLHAGPLSISETIQRTKPNTSTNATICALTAPDMVLATR